jgi:hypothetical protein
METFEEPGGGWSITNHLPEIDLGGEGGTLFQEAVWVGNSQSDTRPGQMSRG